jgi:hypothetical protein
MAVHHTRLICSYLSWPDFHLSLSFVIMHVAGESELFCSAQTATLLYNVLFVTHNNSTWLSMQMFIT